MGRPRKPLSDKYATPPRILGRVSDDKWKLILAGAAASGKNKTQWITETLILAARGLLYQNGEPPCNDGPPEPQELDSHDPQNDKQTRSFCLPICDAEVHPARNGARSNGVCR